MSQIVWTFPGGKLEQIVTSVTLVNNTAKEVLTTVPAGKRWIILGIRMTQNDDVARDLSVTIYDVVAKTNLLRRLVQKTGVAQWDLIQWPNTLTGIHNTTNMFALILLKAGNTIGCNWSDPGASAGAVDADGLVVEYLEIDA